MTDNFCRDENKIDTSNLSFATRQHLAACQMRNIAPGMRRIERHNPPKDWESDEPFHVFEVVSEVIGCPGTRLSIGFAARAGDARLLCAAERLLEIALYVVQQYHNIELDRIEQEHTRELVRRARAATVTFTQAILGTADECDCHRTEGR